MSIRRLLVASAAVGALVLSPLAGSASAKTVSPKQWAPKFCTTLSTWLDELKSDAAKAKAVLSGEVSDLAAAKSELVSFLGKTVSNTNRALSALKKAGAPSSVNGEKIAAVFVKGLQSALGLFKSAKTKAENISTSDLTRFASEGSAIASALNEGGSSIDKSFGGVGKLDKGGKLAKALQQEPSCAFLSSTS